MQFIALVHAPAAEVFEGLYNPDERHKWDTYVTHGKVVEDRKGSSKTNTQVPVEDFHRSRYVSIFPAPRRVRECTLG